MLRPAVIAALLLTTVTSSAWAQIAPPASDADFYTSQQTIEDDHAQARDHMIYTSPAHRDAAQQDWQNMTPDQRANFAAARGHTSARNSLDPVQVRNRGELRNDRQEVLRDHRDLADDNNDVGDDRQDLRDDRERLRDANTPQERALAQKRLNADLAEYRGDRHDQRDDRQDLRDDRRTFREDDNTGNQDYHDHQGKDHHHDDHYHSNH